MASTTSRDRGAPPAPPHTRNLSPGVPTISALGTTLFWVLTVYLLLLIARAVMDLVLSLSRTYRPAGAVTLVLEVVYTATDPPLRLLRRIIPPLRIANIAFDLGFLLLFIVIVVLRGYAQQL